MNRPDEISAEMKSAFVDGQLDAADWSRMVERMGRDAELRRSLCDLRATKDMVKGAYADATAPAAPADRPLRWHALAAALLIAACAAAVWLVDGMRAAPPAADVQRAADARAPLGAGDRVLVHVSSNRHETLGTALDEVEDLLRAAGAAGRAIEVEIVANSSGLDLLRAGGSPFEARLAALRARYPNLLFFACNQTIDRMREKGVEVRLLPAVQVAPSALDEVVRRLQSGWVYIRA